jgi:hypothetical protein
MKSWVRMVGTAMGSAAMAATPVSVAAVPETESNNTFPGQPATVGVTYSPASLCLGCAPPFLDTIDFFHYTGLPSGGTFDLSFDPIDLAILGHTLRAGLYTDQTNFSDSVTSTTPGPLVHLTGLIPGGGELTFGITTVNATDFEGYTVALSVAPPRVPAPAAIVLLAAGLTALGLDVARRRKRS